MKIEIYEIKGVSAADPYQWNMRSLKPRTSDIYKFYLTLDSKITCILLATFLQLIKTRLIV